MVDPFRLSRTACGSRASALRQRPRVLDAVPGVVEEHVDLPGEEQHGDDQQDRDRRDDERVLSDRLALFAVAKGCDRGLHPNIRAQQDAAHFEGTSTWFGTPERPLVGW